VSGELLLSTPGPQIVTASVKGRGIAGDDRLDAVLDVRQPTRVLIVSFSPGGAASDDAAQYVRAALSPFSSAGRRGVDPATAQVISAASLATTSLLDYEAIVLADVASLDPGTAQKLERFVGGGGGLVVSVGDRTQSEALGASMFRGGAGALPAELGERGEEPLDAGLEMQSQDHPVLRALSALDVDATTGVVKRWLAASPAPSAHVLARLSSGQPLLIERSFGRGKVILLTTSLGARWGKLPATALYVPLVQSMVNYVATAGADKHNLEVGEEIVATLAQPPVGRAMMTLPDGASAPCDVVTLNDQTQARFTQTQQPGVYRMRVGPLVIPFVVRAKSDESDLSPLVENRWQWLEHSLGLQRVDRAENAVAALAATDGRSLWLPLVLAVIAVLIVEMGLMRWWSR
jgi:uncharacterized membrane protein